jgi:hypothetical protein
MEGAQGADRNGVETMKQVTRYEIRAFNGSEYSKPLSAKLRDRSRAIKLVKRLKSRGVIAFASPLKIAA